MTNGLVGRSYRKLNKPGTQPVLRIRALGKDGERYDVEDVLRNAICEWRKFIGAKGL